MRRSRVVPLLLLTAAACVKPLPPPGGAAPRPEAATGPNDREDDPGLMTANHLLEAAASTEDCTEALAILRQALEWSRNERVYAALGHRGCRCRDADAVRESQAQLKAPERRRAVAAACAQAGFAPPATP